MAKKKIWEFPENTNPQPQLVFLVDENFTTQKLSLSGLTSSDYFAKFLAPVSSGSYDPNTGCITFTTVSAGTFNVCGFSNGTVTGFTYDSNTNDLTILRVGLPDLTVNIAGSSGISGISGLQGVSGISGKSGISGNSGISGISGISGESGISGNSGISGISGISGLQGISGISGSSGAGVSGFTYDNNNNLTIIRNEPPNLTVNITIFSGLTVNGNLSATTYYGDGSNLSGSIISGSFNNNTDTITLVRNGGNISITGITDYYVTGVTYSQGTLTLNRQDGSVSTTILPDWATSVSYNTKDLVIALYENEYRLFRALTGFTSSGVSFPGGQTIATDVNSYVGQWQEVSPLRGGMGNVSFSGSVSYAGTITPPALSADTNNYNPTGLATCNFMRLVNSTGGNINLTGLKAPSPVTNQAIFICNVGVTQITMPNNSASSLAANRFILGNNRVLQNDEGIMLIYDPISACWRSQAIQV